MDNTTTSVHGPGLMGGLTSLAKNVLGLVVSRLELVALELYLALRDRGMAMEAPAVRP